jgi:hypothetical protein
MFARDPYVKHPTCFEVVMFIWIVVACILFSICLYSLGR